MRYSTKITLLLVGVSALPVAASGLVSSTLSTNTVTAETLQLQRELVRQVAAQVDTWAASILRDLERAGSYLPFDRASGDDLAALLRVPYRQLGYATAVMLVDGTGKPRTRPAYLAADGKVPADDKLPADLRGRVRLRAGDLERLAREIPSAAKLVGGGACSDAYRGRGGTRLACAVQLSVGRLAAEVKLDRVAALLGSASRYGGRLYITDAAHRVVVSSGEPKSGTRLSHLRRLGAGRRSVERYTDEAGREVFGTVAPVARLGWHLRLEQPTERALGPARRLGLYTVLWTLLCLALAVAGGVYLGRGVTGPVGRLAKAARAIAAGGNLDQRVPAASRDELGQLAEAFNAMVDEVSRSMTVIGEQRDELQRWNDQLKQRVEARTREVQEALEQVIRSQKMGALGELSAGVAHELNNPLASIMLASQLAQVQIKDPDSRETLDTIIEQAHRMHEITQRLLRFAETPEGVVRRPVGVPSLCREALQLARTALQESSVETMLDLPDDLAKISGDSAELQQALLHLIYNAARAMPDGGTLTIEAREVKEAVRIMVRDTGSGIAADKIDRIFEPFFAEQKPRTRGAGLGLSVVDRIVREHDGRITVRSTVGDGTEFNLYFPGLRKQLHL